MSAGKHASQELTPAIPVRNSIKKNNSLENIKKLTSGKQVGRNSKIIIFIQIAQTYIMNRKK